MYDSDPWDVSHIIVKLMQSYLKVDIKVHSVKGNLGQTVAVHNAIDSSIAIVTVA